jgi:hypothetical protein
MRRETSDSGGKLTYVAKQRIIEPGSITWAYGEGMLAVKDWKVVAVPHRWLGLSDAVSCVDRAREMADSATSNATTGLVVAWTGAGIALAGVGTGLGMWAYDWDDDDLFTAGILSMLISGGVGLVLAFIGADRVFYSRTQAVDAVNIYNDFYQETPGCQDSPP